MKKIVYILILLVGLSACKKAKYIQVHSFPEVYVLAYEQDHGRCYDSVPFGVVSLDLYSEGLTLDTNRRMQGSGYNLYLSDIFVPGDTLASGQYTSLNSKHSTLNSYTFLPGRDYDGTPNGAYLLTIDQGKLQSVQLIDSGYMTVCDTTNGLTDLQFTLYYTKDGQTVTTYTPHFQGALQSWQNK